MQMIDRSAWISEVARSALGYLGLLHGPDGVMACVIGYATHADAERALGSYQGRLFKASPPGLPDNGPPKEKYASQREHQPFPADLRGRADLQADDSKTGLLERLIRRGEGGRDDFLDIQLRLGDRTPFQLRVLTCCRAIPWGKTRTYGQMARAAGSPGAARAVGQVMATNRLPLIVPCHRVVPASGGLGGFSAPQGIDLKRRLLEQEQLTDC